MLSVGGIGTRNLENLSDSQRSNYFSYWCCTISTNYYA